MRGRVAVSRLIVTAGVILSAACSRSDFPATPPVAQGTAVTGGGLEMTVTDTLLDAVPGGCGYSWGIYVVVKVHVSNVSGKQAFFAPMLQELFINGRVYEANPPAAESFGGQPSSSSALNPGSGADVALAFGPFKDGKPPLQNKTVQLALYGELDSPGAVVALPNNQPKPALAMTEAPYPRC
jgi:hypothetical protein